MKNNTKSVQIKICPVEKINTHVDSTMPQISFDQMSIMAHQHKSAINNSLEWQDPHNSPPLPFEYICNTVRDRTKLTRSKLKKSPDWLIWELSEFKQLDQYLEQNMFGEPCPRPYKSNILPLIWTYVIKHDGTKKARCVCNGSPRQKGTVTLGNTYTASLEQSGSRLFWSLIIIEL